MQNPINWFEIPVVDFEKGVEFYSKTFEYEIQPMEMGPNMMGFFPGGPEGLGATGAVVRGPGQVPNLEGLGIYFNCGEDLTTTLERAVTNGAKVIVPKSPVGEFGFIAQFIDPQGNRIGLHSQG